MDTNNRLTAAPKAQISKREASPKARRFVVGENAGQRDTTGNLATGFSDVQSLTAFVNCA